MTFNNIILIGAVTLASLLTGCNLDESDTTSKTELEGNWKVGCTFDDDGGYEILTANYSGNSVSSKNPRSKNVVLKSPYKGVQS